jgi:tRNA pseudouridine55 synthase
VTDDATGDVLAVADAGGVTDDDVARGVRELTGPLSQVPSRVSAVKVAGVRAYDLVRAGADVVLAPRHVVVTRFDVLALRRERLPAGTTVVDADVAVDCSSGTYVRALARDLGAALGVGGHLTTLRRTRVGPYRVADAVPLAALGPDLPLIGLGEAAAAAFPRLDLDAGSARRLVHGVPLGRTGLGPGPVAAFGPDGTFLALVADAGPVARSLAVFVG